MKTHAQPAVPWAFSPRTSSVGKAGIHRPAARAADGWAVSAGAAFDAVLRSCRRPVSDRVRPRSSLVGKCCNIGSRGCAAQFRCQLPADANNSAAGRLVKIVSKLLILLYSWVLEGRFSGVTTRFLPDGRGMRRGLLRGDAAVDDETGAGHEAGIVRSEKDDALGDVAHGPHAADRQPGQRLAARLLDVVGAEVARPHDEHLIAHFGFGRAGVDRVDANAVALARELECRGFGEERHPALGHR